MSSSHAFDHLVLPDILTVEDLARYIPLSPTSIRAHLRAGRLPGRKIGRRWLIDREALLSYLSPPTAGNHEPPILRLLDPEGGAE